MRELKAGFVYFALVLGAGFVLGMVRVPFLVPRLGMRVAELIEMPIMFVVILRSAGFVVRRFDLPPSTHSRLTTGVVALGLSVAAELLLALLLQGQSLGQFFASRDPVSGGVYLLLLALFALLPLILARRPVKA